MTVVRRCLCAILARCAHVLGINLESLRVFGAELRAHALDSHIRASTSTRRAHTIAVHGTLSAMPSGDYCVCECACCTRARASFECTQHTARVASECVCDCCRDAGMQGAYKMRRRHIFITFYSICVAVRLTAAIARASFCVRQNQFRK